MGFVQLGFVQVIFGREGICRCNIDLMAGYDIDNNRTTFVITNIINVYDYMHNVIDSDYNYVSSGSNDYDYLGSCNRLQSITIID